MNDLTMTNVWLAILAIVSLTQFLMICAAGLFAYKLYRQTMTTIDNIERTHIAPLRARVDGILDEVEVVTGKVRDAQESVSHAIHTAAGAGSLIAGAVMAKSWPVVGIINGVRIAARAMFADKETNGPRAVGGNSRSHERPGRSDV